MRPSDVGRRLSLHVQSPPPIALNIKLPQRPAFPPPKNTATTFWFRSFPQSCLCIPVCPRRAARAHYVSTLIPTWRSRTLREVMHRPPRRGKCVLIRTESCMSASRTNSGSLVSMASIRQKARMFFLPPSSRPTSTMFINKGLLCEARVNCQARQRKDFFAVIALFRAGCKICIPAS